MKKFLLITLLIIFLLLIFFFFFNKVITNYRAGLLEKDVVKSLDKINYCDTSADCKITCSYITHSCGKLYLYNQNESLEKIENKIIKYDYLCSKNKCGVPEYMCDIDYCAELDRPSSVVIQSAYENILCENNKCVFEED